MSARERILDTYEGLLISDGERAATLDAVAARAGVSKGGLLYHFPSREALSSGLVARARGFAAEYLADLEAAPEGPTVAYIRTSAETTTALDRTLLALSKLSGHPAAVEALRAAQGEAEALVLREVSDPGVARAIVLMGDGLYYNALFGLAPDPSDVERLVGVVMRLKEQARA